MVIRAMGAVGDDFSNGTDETPVFRRPPFPPLRINPYYKELPHRLSSLRRNGYEQMCDTIANGLSIVALEHNCVSADDL
jgi:hypothetical protein